MGGMETWSAKLVEHLEKLVRVETVVLPGRENGMPPSWLKLLLFPITVLRFRLRPAAKVRAVIFGDMALWPLALLWNFNRKHPKLLIAAHGTDVAYHRRGGTKGSMYKSYLRLGARILAHRMTVLANSRATADVAAETGWHTARVVPLAADPVPCEVRPLEKATILFAGRLVKRKGCGWFVREVLPHLPDDIVLKIAGTGWDEDEAEVLAHDRVKPLGPLTQHELASAYASALCVIVPNIEVPNGEYEGFGLVAPEAAMAGGVVLAADHGGLRDAVMDGQTGFLLPAGDVAGWLTKIAEIANWSDAERAHFRDGAQATSGQHYSWARVAGDVARLAGVTA